MVDGIPIQLDPGRALLVVVDLQERLLPAIAESGRVVTRSVVLIRAARALGIPLLWTEQYKKGLGETVPEVVEAIGDAARPMEKVAFGCLGDAGFAQAASEQQKAGRGQMILVGIETHVCVLQTALKALAEGWTVYLAEDALGSRRASDRETALRRLTQAGAVPATVEMLIMEALGVAQGEKFKAILPLLKEI